MKLKTKKIHLEGVVGKTWDDILDTMREVIKQDNIQPISTVSIKWTPEETTVTVVHTNTLK